MIQADANNTVVDKSAISEMASTVGNQYAVKPKDNSNLRKDIKITKKIPTTFSGAESRLKRS